MCVRGVWVGIVSGSMMVAEELNFNQIHTGLSIIYRVPILTTCVWCTRRGNRVFPFSPFSMTGRTNFCGHLSYLESKMRVQDPQSSSEFIQSCPNYRPLALSYPARATAQPDQLPFARGLAKTGSNMSYSQYYG